MNPHPIVFNPRIPVLTDGALVIDNSTFEWLNTCFRGAQQMVLQKRQYDGSAAALNFGGAVHAALEHRYRTVGGGPAQETVAEQVKVGLAYLADHPIPHDDWHTADLLLDILYLYQAEYPCEQFKVLQVEVPFALPLGTIPLAEAILLPNKSADGTYGMLLLDSIPVIWSGKIDLLVEDSTGLWNLDHKTTSIFGATYYDQFYRSNQMLGYNWAARQMLNQPVLGSHINVIALSKAKTPVHRFGRAPITYAEHQYEYWPKNTLHLISLFFQCLVDDFFPEQTSGCIKYNRRCDYWDVCQAQPEMKNVVLQSGQFKDVTWSPLTA